MQPSGGQGHHPNPALAQQDSEQGANQSFRNNQGFAAAVSEYFNKAVTSTCSATYDMSIASPTAMPSHSYHYNPDGTLVNTTQGVIPVNKSRAVMIRSLNHRASPEDVREYFSSAGTIEHCDIRASRDEKKKCTATLAYKTAEEANAAVRRFDGTNFMGRRISAEVAKDDSAVDSSSWRAISDVVVRRTSEATAAYSVPRPTSKQGPLIVNGSDDNPLHEEATSSSKTDKGKGKEKGMSTLE